MTTAPSSVHHRHHFARFFSVHPGVLPCPIMISAAFWTMHGNRDLRKAIQDDGPGTDSRWHRPACNRTCHQNVRHRPPRRVTRKTARLSRFGRAETSSATVTRATYASLSHFCRKLFFAAPVSALPFLSTAFGSHASRLHFVRKLVLAAPTSALPFLSTARLSQVPCAIAAPRSANEATT